MRYSVSFPEKRVQYLLNTTFSSISELVKPDNTVIITDKNVNKLHGEQFENFKAVIEIGTGEKHKVTNTVEAITEQLLSNEVHRGCFILGVGGGLVTDITGFVASIYMRGVNFGFVPTTLLGMVDAAVGGKNGINFNKQKNLLGSFNQPDFILFDQKFLNTLPEQEWSNGFAEVIKYACLFDDGLFKELSENDISYYKQNNAALASLIGKCVDWKNKIVLTDERESGKRKILNFGHTAGHAFETVANLPHGYAVGLGMLVACRLSEQKGLVADTYDNLKTMLKQYGLPQHISCDIDDVMQVITMDKKRNSSGIDFVLLKDVGQPVIENISIDTIKIAVEYLVNESNS